MTDPASLPHRRLASLVDGCEASIASFFSACSARAYPATVGVVVRLPNGCRNVGADTVESARAYADAVAFDPGDPPTPEPKQWALVVASRTLVGWVSLELEGP